MEIILKETIETLGQEGEVVKVRPGYARNFLVPKQKAVLVSKASLAQLEKEKQAIAARLAEQKKQAEGLAAQLDFTARSADENARLRIKAETSGGEYRFNVSGPNGFDTGWASLDQKATVSLPLPKPGKHVFKVQIEQADGNKACDDQLVEIIRTEATAAAIHATRTVSVKVAEGPASERRNVLHPLIRKGTALPVEGSETLKLREKLVRTCICIILFSAISQQEQLREQICLFV